MSATSNDVTNASMALAVGLVRTWVSLYTLGLPQQLRDARRLEIDCDLWEQRQLAGYTREPPLGTATEIVVRAAFGVLSDITWRVEAGLSARRNRSMNMNESLATRGLFLAAVGLAITPAFFGFYMIGGGGEWNSAAERIIVGLLTVSTAAAMLSGLLLSAGRPTLGIALVAVGGVGISVMWFWMAFLTGPIAIGLITIAYFRARRTGWPKQAGTA